MSVMSKDELFVNSEKTEFFIVEYLLALTTFRGLAAEAVVKNLGVWLDNSEGALGRGYPIPKYVKKN